MWKKGNLHTTVGMLVSIANHYEKQHEVSPRTKIYEPAIPFLLGRIQVLPYLLYQYLSSQEIESTNVTFTDELINGMVYVYMYIHTSSHSCESLKKLQKL